MLSFVATILDVQGRRREGGRKKEEEEGEREKGEEGESDAFLSYK